MEFKYIKLGLARIVPSDQYAGPGVPIYPNNWIYGVAVLRGNGTAAIGAVQENPSLPGQWRAVVSVDGKYPKINFDQGLWPLTPGISGLKTRREASAWLYGVHCARSDWFAEAVEEGNGS